MSLPSPIRDAAFACLLELYPLWISQPLLDQRRKVEPGDEGTSTIKIELYRGVVTTGEFYDVIKGCAHLPQLIDAIDIHRPEILKYLAMSGAIGCISVESLVSAWLSFIQRTSIKHDLRSAITITLDRFAEIVEEKFITGRIVSSIAGFSLPQGVDRIQLEEGIILRRLTKEEITEMGSHDIFSEPMHSPLSFSVSTCFEKSIEIPCRFEKDADHSIEARANIYEEVSNFLIAAHVLKKGKAQVFHTTIHFDPAPVPCGNFNFISQPSNRQPSHAQINVELDEVDELLALYKGISKCKRNEVTIACGRLVDAEHRTSPVDALLDAVIGLEAVLNPNDFGELSFRVALNYAFLDVPAMRRKRYDVIKGVQAVRNKVVHGGLSMNSSSSHIISDHAEIGIDCLRDCIKRFIVDASLNNGSKLTALFGWIASFHHMMSSRAPDLRIRKKRGSLRSPTVPVRHLWSG